MRGFAVGVAALLVLAAGLVVLEARRGPEETPAEAAVRTARPAEAPPASGARAPEPPAAARPRPEAAAQPEPSDPPAAAAEPAPLFDARGEPSRAFVRASLERALAERLPRVKLSPDDVELLTDAVLTLREARQELARLADEPGAAERRHALREAIASASGTFTEILDMGPEAFTEQAGPGGVDSPDPEEVVPPGETIDEWNARQERER